MSSKMDMQGARTAADLERKYQFKSFSEVLGVANDAQTHAYNAEKAVEKLSKEVSELSILLKDEETGLQAQIEAKLDTEKLVSQFNMAFNEITITSDNFSLTKEGVVTAKKGLLGGWDIEDKRILKNTAGSLVQIAAPESADSDFITVALLENGAVTKTPLSIKANGDIYTNGKVISASEDYSAYTEINNGSLFANRGEIGGWKFSDDSFSKDYLGADGVMHSVGLSVRLVESDIGKSKVLYADRSDGNGTIPLFYIRPNGEAYFGSSSNDRYVWISNGAIFSHRRPALGQNNSYSRILLMYFTGGNDETMGLWVTGHYENGVFVYTGLSVESV